MLIQFIPETPCAIECASAGTHTSKFMRAIYCTHEINVFSLLCFYYWLKLYLLGAIALSYPPRVRVRAMVKLSAAFFNDESSITIGGEGTKVQ